MLKYDDGGLRDVWLVNGYEVHKTAYGKAVSFHDVHGLTRAICRALTNKPGRLTGAEFRYLRLHLRLSQASLGKLLDVTEQSIALWEKRGRIPLLADKHLRLLWAWKNDGNETIVRAMARLNDVERLVHQKIVVEELPRKGWTAKAEELEDARGVGPHINPASADSASTPPPQRRTGTPAAATARAAPALRRGP